MADLYLYLYGTLQIANLFLAIVAGSMALTLFKVSHEKKHLRPWKVLIAALIVFAVLEVVGALRSFGIFTSPFLTHILTTCILGLLILALTMQLRVGEE